MAGWPMERLEIAERDPRSGNATLRRAGNVFPGNCPSRAAARPLPPQSAGEGLRSSASLNWPEPAAEIHPKVSHFLGRGAVTPLPVRAASRKSARARMCGRKTAPTASSAAMSSCTCEAWRAGGHWLSRKTNSLPMSFSLRPVTSAAQMSNVAGLVGTIERSVAFIAASDLGDSKCGVSTMTRLILRLERAVNAAGSLAAGTASTGKWGSCRLDPHRTADFWGSRSRIKTRSPASWAATARLAASVVLPQPPFCETKAMIRMDKTLRS
jgi:hypothetical protein